MKGNAAQIDRAPAAGAEWGLVPVERRKGPALGRLRAVLFTLPLLFAMAVCAICDLAISGGFGWSLYPISSIAFAWLVLCPLFRWGGRGVRTALLALSAAIAPFLWVLDRLVGTSPLLLPIGLRMAFLSVLYLWLVYGLFRHDGGRRLRAAGLSLLLALPTQLLINLSLSRFFPNPLFDVWDALAFAVLSTAAAALLLADATRHSPKRAQTL